MAYENNKLYLIICDLFLEKIVLQLNALVTSIYIIYQYVRLNWKTENLLTTVEKQLSWPIKACFNRKKFYHSSGLETYSAKFEGGIR